MCVSWAYQLLPVLYTSNNDNDDDGMVMMGVEVRSLVGQQHNEAKDAVGVLAFTGVETCDEGVHESSSTDSPDETLIADLQVCGVWIDVLFECSCC